MSMTNDGEAIYFGSVFPLRGAATQPTYVYERRVEARGDELVSTHVTRDALGAIVLAESAKHTSDYRLVEYRLHENQLGQTGTIRVDGTRVTFARKDRRGERVVVEQQEGFVVTGPTLVGHLHRHLDALRDGATLTVRLALLDRLETVGFHARAVSSELGRTRVRMKPSSVFVALLVDPIDFTFDDATGNILRLEGRVPPKLRERDRLRDFDARVEYRFVAASYR